MNDSWYKVTIFKNPFSRDVIWVADSRKIYEVTFENGKKDLIRILSKDLYINVKSILNNKMYKITYNGFFKIVKENKIKETEYKEE